jgi:hypothetical protein
MELSSIPPCIPDSHLYRITSTKCRINIVVFPDDGHIVVRNMLRKEINILRKVVHQIGFIYKIMQVWTVNRTHTQTHTKHTNTHHPHTQTRTTHTNTHHAHTNTHHTDTQTHTTRTHKHTPHTHTHTQTHTTHKIKGTALRVSTG